MGMDIHMNIIDIFGNYVIQDIFDGRNSEWFHNMMMQSCNEDYENLPAHYGIPMEVPEDIKHDIETQDYFGAHYIVVKDFIEWFEKTRPDIDAGWVTTYDKWAYEKKGRVPEYCRYLGEVDNINDYHFIEIANIYDCSKWLYDFIKENDNILDDEDIIVYYFDN